LNKNKNLFFLFFFFSKIKQMAQQKCSAQMDGAKEKEKPDKCCFTYTIQKTKKKTKKKKNSVRDST